MISHFLQNFTMLTAKNRHSLKMYHILALHHSSLLFCVIETSLEEIIPIGKLTKILDK